MHTANSSTLFELLLWECFETSAVKPAILNRSDKQFAGPSFQQFASLLTAQLS